MQIIPTPARPPQPGQGSGAVVASFLTPVNPMVTYWAISILSSRTVWVNTAVFLVSVLSATDVLQIIPPRYVPLVSACVAGLNLYLRTQTVRPVAWIPAGTSTPVPIARIDPPAPTSAA